MEVDVALPDASLVGSHHIEYPAPAEPEAEEAIEGMLAEARRRVWAGRTRSARVEEVEDEEDEGRHNAELGNDADESLDDDDSDTEVYEAISAWDRIREQVQRKGGISSKSMSPHIIYSTDINV